MVTTGVLAGLEAGDTPCSSCRYVSCVPFPFFREDKWWHCDDCDMVTAELYKVGAFYTRIELTCPNQAMEEINVAEDLVTDRDTVRRKLPSYCREYCEDRFNN
jgi:hypothetical protein